MYSQEKYNSFIIDVQKVFATNQLDYQKLSNNVMEKHFDREYSDNVSFIFIPELLLKKSKKLYNKIDTTNVIKYFDAQSMFYHKILVYSDTLIGQIWSHSKNINKYQSKSNNSFDSLFIKLKAIKPEIIFTVQNINGYFYIKNNEIYVLCDCITYTIDSYTEKFREELFTVFFHYQPREKYIVCY
jgi:hypothetical protein